MAKYRKKPIVIEAEQFHLGEDPPEGVEVVVISRADDALVLGAYDGVSKEPNGNLGFGIKTLEGWHVVMHDDWIITGIQGERYPCKPDIFEATYEAVEDE